AKRKGAVAVGLGLDGREARADLRADIEYLTERLVDAQDLGVDAVGHRGARCIVGDRCVDAVGEALDRGDDILVPAGKHGEFVVCSGLALDGELDAAEGDRVAGLERAGGYDRAARIHYFVVRGIDKAHRVVVLVVLRRIDDAAGSGNAGARVGGARFYRKTAVAVADLEEHRAARVAVGNLAILADPDQTLPLVPVVSEAVAVLRYGCRGVPVTGEQVTAIAVLLVRQLEQGVDVLPHLDRDQGSRLV